jgi:hypothetical protein
MTRQFMQYIECGWLGTQEVHTEYDQDWNLKAVYFPMDKGEKRWNLRRELINHFVDVLTSEARHSTSYHDDPFTLARAKRDDE